MPKQIPKVFANKIDKQINNNDKVFYSKDKVKKIIEESKNSNEEDIRSKVLKLFNSPNFVYKMDVTIVTKDNQVLDKKIIALVNDTILTLEEDKIPLNNIKNIKEKTT